MKKLRITVSGQIFEVDVEVLDSGQPAPAARPPRRGGASVGQAPMSPPASSGPKAEAAPGSVPSPLAGTVVSITAKPGQTVKSGDNLVVLEAMKMNTFINATGDGTVKDIFISPGDAVEEGQALISLE